MFSTRVLICFVYGNNLNEIDNINYMQIVQTTSPLKQYEIRNEINPVRITSETTLDVENIITLKLDQAVSGNLSSVGNLNAADLFFGNIYL